MSLETILKKIEHAWNSADEDIADYFFKKVQNWEEKGINKYMIGLGIDLSIIITGVGTKVADIVGVIDMEKMHPYKDHWLKSLYEGPAILWYFTAPFMLFYDLSSNFTKMRIQNDTKYFSDVKTVDDPFNQLRETLRLPYAAFGLMTFTDYLLPVFKYGPQALIHGNTNSITATLVTCLMAASFYITHNKPAAPDKEPFWKKAYHFLQEKFVPDVNIPVPVVSENKMYLK